MCQFYNCAYKHVKDPTYAVIRKLGRRITDLEKDKNIVEPNKTYPCEKCKCISNTEKKLRKHVEKNHLEIELKTTLEDDFCGNPK